jgi:outer membrane protein OmpA-like peptidoglycan-associated protein
MRHRVAIFLLAALLGGCASNGRSFSIFFPPYSSELDPQAQETVQTAATFAKAHRFMPVSVAGYSAPPDPGRDVEGLSQQRAQVVRNALVQEGVGQMRIETLGNGILYPGGLPNLAVRRVDINIGL